MLQLPQQPWLTQTIGQENQCIPPANSPPHTYTLTLSLSLLPRPRAAARTRARVPNSWLSSTLHGGSSTHLAFPLCGPALPTLGQGSGSASSRMQSGCSAGWSWWSEGSKGPVSWCQEPAAGRASLCGHEVHLSEQHGVGETLTFSLTVGTRDQPPPSRPSLHCGSVLNPFPCTCWQNG